MVIHSYTGLYSEVTPSQEIGGGGARNTALPDRERSTIVWYIFIGRNTCSIAVIPDHDRRENCRRANVMITYCVNILRSYSEVTPPQKSGGGALEVQQYQNMRGREQGSPRISGGRGC